MTQDNPLLNDPLLRELAPYTVAGYALFREIIETDGALPARIKAIFAAVAAVNKSHAELARSEMKRAAGMGVTLKEAAAGLILLSSLRGEGTAMAYKAVLDEVWPQPATKPGARPDIRPQPGEAETNFKQYFGTVPVPLAHMLRLVPKGADAYYLMRKGTIECNTLDKKYAELLLITVLATDYSPMVATHIRGARAAGASDAELAEAILCAVPSAGIAAWMGAAILLDTP